MKLLTCFALTLLSTLPLLAEGKPEEWMSSYYQNPTPEKFVAQVHAMIKDGTLANEKAQPPLVAFLSQVMAANPKQLPEWLEEFKGQDEKPRTALWAAAWYSSTAEARQFFEKEQLDAYKQAAPKVLELEVNTPTTLDMLWGYFMATGKEEPIRRIISAFSLSKHAGALDRFKTSAKTEQDKKEAYLDVTFQAAQWSLESNCRQHPVVLKHCETIFADPKLPKDHSLWLGILLSKVKPEKYSLKVGEEKDKPNPSGKLTTDPEPARQQDRAPKFEEETDRRNPWQSQEKAPE